MARQLTGTQPASIARRGHASVPLGLLVALVALAVTLALAVIGPEPFGLDPNAQALRQRNMPPSDRHLLGHDHLGRDVLARLLAGLSMSLTVAALSLAVAVVAGVVPALVLAAIGGLPERAFLGLIDLLRAMPGVLLALVLAAAFGAGLWPLSLAVGLTFAPPLALVTHVALRRETGMPYVDALHALGASWMRIAVGHVLPNIAGPLVTQVAILFPRCIVTESVMSFLGLGASPDMITWGRMIAQASRFFEINWIAVLAPTLAIGVLTLALTVLGNSVRHHLDPLRNRGRP